MADRCHTIKEKLWNFLLFVAHRSRMNIYCFDVSIDDDYHPGTFTPSKVRNKEFVKT